MTPLDPPIHASVLTVSDRCSRGESTDASGPRLCEILRRQLGASIVHTACVPDDPERIASQFQQWALSGDRSDLILSTGGTGLSPRDHTPEAARRVIEREHPGLLELARSRCLAKTPLSYLSRGVAGTLGRSLILTLPGSPRGASEFLEALLDVLPHAVSMLRGDPHDQCNAPYTAP